MSYYTRHNNTFTQILRLVKTNLYQNTIYSAASNPKFFWKLIN